MRFSHIATIYFMMGVIVVGAGVVPVSQIGIGSVFLDTGGDDVSVGDEVDDGGDGGLLDNLIGPVKNALDTISGGALLAVWGAVSKMTGFVAWPVVTAGYLGAPDIVTMLMGVLLASFVFGTLRVFRSSI